jgi:DNA-binding CsgD family transcriptional regulator
MAKKKTLLRAEKESIRFPSTELARLWRIPFSDETEYPKVERALRERIKELNCLYGVSQLAERHFNSLENLLAELVNFLPHSWQFPEITYARIVFKENTYKSEGFKVTRWRQSSRIYVYSEPVGEVAIFYLEECPPADEGPFLAEERALLDALADQIGTIATRISAEMELQDINKQLSLERKALQESNAALRTVLTRIEEEKNEIYRNIKTNVDKVLMPILLALALEIPTTQSKYVEMLKTNLEEITSQFVRHLSNSYHSLTPTEITICNMIRNGLRTKEIARTRGVSAATINRHRENIRRKLKIINNDVNLATYLQSSMWEEETKL